MDLGQTTSLVAMVFTLTEIVKKTGLPTKWSPLVSLGLALALSFILNADKNIGIVIGEAIAAAAAAGGIYSGTKSLAK